MHHHILSLDYLSSNPNALGSLEELVDASHILFGSDYLFAPEAVTFFAVQGMQNFNGFGEQARIAIE